MRDDQMDELLTDLRDGYNAPPETPRDEMWSAIQARLGAPGAASRGGTGSVDAEVLSMAEARRARMRRIRKPLGWASAAAAILVLGLGIGRATAPGVGPETVVAAAANPEVLRVAAVEHLIRTESLLTLVRADARAGRIEPAVASWARGLLAQTRLLLDAQGEADPVMADLLEDLELVLAQIVGAANADEGDQARVRSELNLALDGIEDHEVLPRIQAVIPAGPRFVGT